MCVCVSINKIHVSKKTIETINFIFGGGLPCEPVRTPFNFERNCPGVRVDVWGGGGGPKFGRNDKELDRFFFERL